MGLETQRQEPRANPEHIGITFTTIHKTKGGEADAVLIALPNPKALRRLPSAWRDDTTETSETLRVYYVAITRARRPLGFTYPYSTHGEMVKHLQGLDIEFAIASECEVSAPDRRQRQRQPRGPAGMEAIPGLGWGE